MNPRFEISDAPQGSLEWLRARAGHATGSRAKDMLAKIKTGEAAARRDYRRQLVAELLTGSPTPSGFVSSEMRWGTEQEPAARMAYEEKTGNIVAEAGFVRLLELRAGCSVDGFVRDGDDFGIIEIKCPKTETHVDYLLDGGVPKDHEPQIIHNLWVTGANWCDFVSFDPRVEPGLQLHVVHVMRDEEKIAAHEREVRAFLDEVDAMLDRVQQFLKGEM